MKDYEVMIDLCASMTLSVKADSFEDAERKVAEMLKDEDKFIAEHRDEMGIWSPEVDEIVEVG